MTCRNISPNGQLTTHHQTCGTFKKSINLGCYVCNRLWDVLLPDERCVVSSLAESESNFNSDSTKVYMDGARTNSVHNCITAASIDEGDLHGHPGCYLLQLAFNTSAVLLPESVPSRSYFRAAFLLQPLDGKTKLEFNPTEAGRQISRLH